MTKNANVHEFGEVIKEIGGIHFESGGTTPLTKDVMPRLNSKGILISRHTTLICPKKITSRACIHFNIRIINRFEAGVPSGGQIVQ
jgi:hypothetical protein